jgi:small-conductance mechanosensitive channel
MGFMVDVTALWEKVSSDLNSFFSESLGKMIIAVVIVLIGFILGRILERITQKLLHELELDRIMQRTGLKISLETVLSNLVAYLVYFIAIIMALNQLGLTTAILYIIVGGVIVLIVVSTLLAIKDYIPNLIAGFFVFRRGMFKIGQRIKLNGTEGKVKKIGLVETEILTRKGDKIFIPNSLLVKSKVVVKKK